MVIHICHYMHHSLSKKQDTVGVLAPNSLVASSLEPFSFDSVSTPCRVNQSRYLKALYLFVHHTLSNENTVCISKYLKAFGDSLSSDPVHAFMPGHPLILYLCGLMLFKPQSNNL